jgi:hypothetical protein
MKATLPTRTPTPSIAIIVSYVAPTDTKGSRVKVEIPRMKVKRFFSLDHAFNSCSDQIESWLYSLEIECMAQAELKGAHAFLVGFNHWEALHHAFGKVY